MYYFEIVMKILLSGYFYVVFINHKGLVTSSILLCQLMERKYLFYMFPFVKYRNKGHRHCVPTEDFFLSSFSSSKLSCLNISFVEYPFC